MPGSCLVIALVGPTRPGMYQISENAIRENKKTGNRNREIQIGEIQFGNEKSENTHRKCTSGKHIGQYGSESTHQKNSNREIPIGFDNSEHTNRRNTIRKLQFGNTTWEI